MLAYVAIIKATKMMSTNNFNSKDTGVVDVIQEMKISNTFDGLVSITWEMWHSLVRTPYMKSICIFWEAFINLKKHALLDTCAKVIVSGEVAFGFELSFVKDYRIYWLISEHNVFELSAVCVYQDNRIHTVPFQTYFVLIVVFISALNIYW